MIKYKIERYESSPTGARITFKDTIKKSELKWHLENGWEIVEKITPVLTPISKWWNNFSITNKIAILAIFIPVLFGGVYFLVEQYQNNKYESLNKDYFLLKRKFENSQSDNFELKKLNKSLIDSLSKLNRKGVSKPK